MVIGFTVRRNNGMSRFQSSDLPFWTGVAIGRDALMGEERAYEKNNALLERRMKRWLKDNVNDA